MASEFFHQFTLIGNRGRREGRVSADTHGPRATKSTRQNHRFSRTTGLPCAMVLTVSFVLSPVRPGFVVTAVSRNLAKLSTCIGAPGPHDFAVRRIISRLAQKAPDAAASIASRFQRP
jgi:hypothetical protein